MPVTPPTGNYAFDASATFQRVVPININFKSSLSPNTYAWDDVYFKNYMQYAERPYYKFKFNCPSLKTSASTYKCTVQAIADFDPIILKKAGYDSSKKYQLSGQIPAVLCTFSNETDSLYGWCFSDDRPPVTKTNLSIGFDKPTTVNVNSYLKQGGFTAVELEILDEYSKNIGAKVEPGATYAWTTTNYDNKKKNANVPSSSYQKTLSAWIRSAMVKRCQVLPSGFTKYPILYSKSITSNDGVPGFIFTINKTFSIQVFPDMVIGPSFAPKDVTTWKNWGCGGSIYF